MRWTDSIKKPQPCVCQTLGGQPPTGILSPLHIPTRGDRGTEARHISPSALAGAVHPGAGRPFANGTISHYFPVFPRRAAAISEVLEGKQEIKKLERKTREASLARESLKQVPPEF